LNDLVNIEKTFPYAARKIDIFAEKPLFIFYHISETKSTNNSLFVNITPTKATKKLL